MGHAWRDQPASEALLQQPGEFTVPVRNVGRALVQTVDDPAPGICQAQHGYANIKTLLQNGLELFDKSVDFGFFPRTPRLAGRTKGIAIVVE